MIFWIITTFFEIIDQADLEFMVLLLSASQVLGL
jgi:hypothetical protein